TASAEESSRLPGEDGRHRRGEHDLHSYDTDGNGDPEYRPDWPNSRQPNFNVRLRPLIVRSWLRGDVQHSAFHSHRIAMLSSCYDLQPGRHPASGVLPQMRQTQQYRVAHWRISGR